ncbi:MAG: helix-turn-helix domain-containing protein [Ferrovibrionaceae bacterium]
MSGMSADKCKVPRAFWSALERIGLHPTAVLRKSRLPATSHVIDHCFFTTAQVFALLSAVEELAGQPGVGMRLIDETETAAHPPFSLATFHARNFRDALLMRARFQSLASPKKFIIREDAAKCVITIDWLYASGQPPAIAVDMDLASLVVLGRRGSCRRIVPARIDLARPDTGSCAHQAFFGCGIQYGASQDRLVFAASDLDLPFPGRNPDLLDILWPVLVSELNDIKAGRTIRAEVKLAIKRRLASGRQDLSDVAQDLGMSERTLQRRITREGATFRELLVEARQELCRQLLKDPLADIDAVSRLLGYQNTSSFYRAFREWEGMTPRRWQELQAAGYGTAGSRRAPSSRQG